MNETNIADVAAQAAQGATSISGIVSMVVAGILTAFLGWLNRGGIGEIVARVMGRKYSVELESRVARIERILNIVPSSATSCPESALVKSELQASGEAKDGTIT